MGYEVLDGRTPGGRGDSLDELAPGHVDVVDLSDLRDPGSDPAGRDPAATVWPRWAKRLSRRHVPTVLVAVVALVAGVLVGGWIDRDGRRPASAAGAERL